MAAPELMPTKGHEAIYGCSHNFWYLTKFGLPKSTFVIMTVLFLSSNSYNIQTTAFKNRKEYVIMNMSFALYI